MEPGNSLVPIVASHVARSQSSTYTFDRLTFYDLRISQGWLWVNRQASLSGLQRTVTTDRDVGLTDISPKHPQHHGPKKSPDHAADGDHGQETKEYANLGCPPFASIGVFGDVP
jgi:hypothetical protein